MALVCHLSTPNCHHLLSHHCNDGCIQTPHLDTQHAHHGHHDMHVHQHAPLYAGQDISVWVNSYKVWITDTIVWHIKEASYLTQTDTSCKYISTQEQLKEHCVMLKGSNGCTPVPEAPMVLSALMPSEVHKCFHTSKTNQYSMQSCTDVACTMLHWSSQQWWPPPCCTTSGLCAAAINMLSNHQSVQLKRCDDPHCLSINDS